MSFIAELLAADLHTRTSREGVELIEGVVQTVQTGTLTATLRGGTAGVPGIHYLASYTPSVGDHVVALRAGPVVLVLGTVA